MHMSLSFRAFARLALIVGLGVGTSPAADQQSPKPKRRPPSEIIEPGTDGGTNTNSLEPVAAKKPFNHPLEQTLKKPFDPFRSEGAFGDVPPSPARPAGPSAVQSKKAKAEADRKRNWVFSSQEEMMGLQTPEEMLGVEEYGPDGAVKVKKSALERYYDRMENKTATTTNQPSGEKVAGEVHAVDREEKSAFVSSPKSGTTSIFDSPVPESRRATGPAYSLNPIAELPGSTDKRFSEYPGLANAERADRPPEKNRAQELRTLEFKQLLDSKPVSSPTIGLGAGGLSPVTPNALNPFSSGGFSRDTFGSMPAATSFPPAPLSASPLTLAPSYQPALTPSSGLDAARPWTPAPAFELPKRKF